jgi:hypothetical protein
VLGLDEVAGGDEVLRHLVLALVIEPTSKPDSLRVPDEASIAPASYATVKRRLPEYAQEERRQRLSTACAARPAQPPPTSPRPQPSPRCHHRQHPRCALVWANSGRDDVPAPPGR